MKRNVIISFTLNNLELSILEKLLNDSKIPKKKSFNIRLRILLVNLALKNFLSQQNSNMQN